MRYPLASLLTGGLAATLLPGAVIAQEIGSTAPRVFADDPEYASRAEEYGNFRLIAGGEARIEYDDNVFAQPVAGASDAVVRVSPYAELSHDGGQLSVRLRGSLDIRRHASETSENSEAARVQLQSGLALGQGQQLSSQASWDRSVEDRGDPEARSQLLLGPRRFDIFTGGLAYRRTSARYLASLEANAQKVDALDAIDADRDYTSYFGQASFGLRPGGSFYVVASSFANRREFRLEEIVPGVDRDSTTYGGKLGIQFADGGAFEGRIAAGVFKFDPDAALQNTRTGFSLDGSVSYRPRRRTAVSLELFKGDVASFRGGASARTDTRIGLRLEQEMRHNFLGRVTAGYQRSDFFGSGQEERTWRTGAELEYLVSRNASLVASVRYATRDSDIALEEFERFSAGVGVRFRF